MSYEKICSESIILIKNTGEFIRNQKDILSEKSVEVKGLHNYVTYVDKTAEKMLVDGLRKILPNSGFITEEETASHKNEEFIWVIDPLDGTTNYIHGLPPFAISVALMQNNKTVIGIIYEIMLDECFYAFEGGSAYLNGKQINVSKTEKVNNSLIATGFPYYNYARIKPFLSTLEFFMKNSHGIRRIGSAATDLAYVACGRFDSFYEYSLSPWDVAAGAFIVEKAGGKVSDFSGGNNYIFGKEIIATNNNIYDEFLKIVVSFMN
ncbi:MAG: inositol monophosphatase [Bacteroidetes bacterium GWA2_30_7]|nr:MAG: inositol monophosphatase [Bacteroidetes bacterium GWA2_30_7]